MAQPPGQDADSSSLPAPPKRSAPTLSSRSPTTSAIVPTPPPGTRNSSSGKSLMQSTDRLNAAPQLPRATAGHRRNNSNLGVTPNDIIAPRSKDELSPDPSHESSLDPSPRPPRLDPKDKQESRVEITPRPGGDWSQFETKYEEAIAKDGLKDLFMISEGGLKVVTEERYRRTVVTAIPDEIRNIKDETWIPECIRVFSTDWTVVQNPEEDRGRQRLLEQSSRLAAAAEKRVINTSNNPIPPAASSSDIGNSPAMTKARRGSSSESAPPNPTGSDIAEDTVNTEKPVPSAALDGSLLKNRPSVPRAPIRKAVEAMLQGVVPKEIPLSMSFARHAERPFPEKLRMRILVEVKELRFMIGDMLLTPEPFFCTLSFYDTFKRRKLSEDFHFDAGLSSEYKLLIVNDQNKVEEDVDPETQASKSIFVVSETHTSIYLVLRINHLMRAEVEKDSIYKTKASKAKDLEKYQKETRDLLLQANPPISPFGWGFLPLFDDVGGLRHNGPVAMREICALKTVLTDEQLYEEINDPDRKQKILTGHLALDIRRVGDKEEPANRIDTALLPVKPFTQTERDPSAFTREIYDFSNTKEYHLSYVNLLFLYPESLKIKSSAANLMIEARLKAIDDPQASGLRVWFGRSSCAKFNSSATTCAMYKETKAAYADELKLKIGRLTPYHHLFFTFYHASANPKKDKRTVLGYAVVPLYRDGRIVLDERMRLPIASELPNRYLDPSAESSIKWLDGKKELFVFRTRILSSLYTRDENLATFMREKEKIKTVMAMDPAVQYQNFPFLLTRLFDSLCSKKEEVAQEAFHAILQVLKSVDQTSDEKTNHNPLLASYVKYMFTNVKGASLLVYEQICRLYLKLLQSNSPLTAEINGFLIEVMVKSMTLKLHETGELYDESTRRTRFSPDFIRNLYKLVTCLFVEKRLQNLEALTTFPFFVRDLFYIMDRGIAFNLVHQYIQNASGDGNFGLTVKHQLVKILCDFEQFVPLNLPISMVLPDAISELLVDHWRTHFLTGLLLTELQTCLPMKKSVRLNGVRLLTPLLKKLDSDSRYADKQRKMRVVDMFFPYVPLLIERYDFLVNELDTAEKRECLIPFVYIVKNLSRELVSGWWKRETQKRQVNFFLTLKLCLELSGSNNSELMADLNQVLLQAVADFLQDFAQDLQVEGSPLLDSLFGVLHLLFETNNLEAFVLWEMVIVQYLVQQYGKPLFVHNTNSYCLHLCSFLLRRCNSLNGVVRSKATALFFLLMKRNYEEEKNLTRVRSQSAVAVSRLVGENALKDSSTFVKSMEVIAAQAKAEPKSSNMAGFAAAAEEVIDRNLKLVTYATKIASNKSDHEMTVDLYHRIALSYTDSPDLRVTWLENLSVLQASAGNLEEAAACKLAIAGLVCEYLKWKNPRKLPFDKSALQSVAPNILKDQSIFSDPIVAQSAGAVFQSDIWNSAGLQRVLDESGDLFAKAGLFDMCVEVSSLQTLVFKTERQYDLLMQCLQRFTDMTKKLIEANKENRSPTRYYRVMLHGKRFEELDGKEFIYKKSSKDNLSVIQNSLREAFAGRVGGSVDNVLVLPNTEVDRSKLDPEKVYLQLASVNPYFDAVEWENRSTAFDRNFNTNMFIFETPYTTGPKLQTDDLSKQQKKKTLFTTELAFPYLKNRLEIVAKRDVIISPIENAIELIEDRVSKLRTELETNPPRINALHQVIQGSVVPMVNAGPLHVCEVFLGRTQSEWPEGHIKTLRKAMEDLTRLCGFSIALSKSIIKPEHIPFQQMVEKHYADMKKKVREYLEPKDPTPTPAPETTPGSD